MFCAIMEPIENPRISTCLTEAPVGKGYAVRIYEPRRRRVVRVVAHTICLCHTRGRHSLVRSHKSRGKFAATPGV
jgi:hypothetical protein